MHFNVRLFCSVSCPGYGLGHIPSAYLGMRLGMRIWYAATVISWGVVAMFAAMVKDAKGLYWQRAVLGLAGQD